ncbi:MAG: hypothetical protein ACYC9S_12630 [Leptospirales bacterium]
MLSVLLILTIIFASISAFEFLPRNVTELQYTEKTLFLDNNTLLNGNYPVINTTYQPSFVYLNPSGSEMYIEIGHTTVVLNTTTDHIVQKLHFSKSWMYYEFNFNSENGSAYVSYDYEVGWVNNTPIIKDGILELDTANNIVANISTPYLYSSITYDPYNSELYAYRIIGFGYQLVTLNNSFYPQKEIYLSPQNAMLEYNPVNHLMYSLNEISNTITVVSPNDTIMKNVTVGAFPDGMALDPSSGSMYVSNVFNLSEVTANLSVTSSPYFDIYSVGNLESLAFDNASHVAVLALGSGKLAVMQGARNLIGYINVGELPTSAFYDPYNHETIPNNPLT